MIEIITNESPFAKAVLDLLGELLTYNEQFDEVFELREDWKGQWLASQVCFAAYVDHRPAGLLLANRRMDPPITTHWAWLEITALYVREAYRKRGVARLLVAKLEEQATEMYPKINEIRLFVSVKNVAAQEFYQSQGYRPIQAIWLKSLE